MAGLSVFGLRGNVHGLRSAWFTLQRAPWKLDAIARRKLAELEADNQPLFQAYLMKESLVAVLDAATPDNIHDLLMDWLRWIDLEGAPPFLKAANTIAEHFDGICAYVHTGHTNARAEGLNRKIRVVTSRAYGFKSVGNLMAMIMWVFRRICGSDSSLIDPTAA